MKLANRVVMMIIASNLGNDVEIFWKQRYRLIFHNCPALAAWMTKFQR
jgi:hypothetical protein